MSSTSIARWLMIAGLALLVAGGLVWLVGRFLDLGDLPGDVAYRGGQHPDLRTDYNSDHSQCHPDNPA